MSTYLSFFRVLDEYIHEFLKGVGSCSEYSLEFLQGVGSCSEYLLEFLQGAHAVNVLVYPEGGSSEQEEEADVRECVCDELGCRALHCLTNLQPIQQIQNVFQCLLEYEVTKTDIIKF